MGLLCSPYQVVSDGTIIGDVQAEKIRLRRSAVVIGNITCISLSMDPDVSVSGKLNVHKEAPSRLHLEGEEEAPEDEVADSLDNKSSDGEKRRPSKKEASKKEGGSAERDRRPKEDKGKDEPRKKKEGESSKSKTSSSK